MRASIVLVTIAAAVASSGCARKHLTPHFGTANREAFLAQRVRTPDQPAPRPNMALDSQETGVIADTYLRGLSGKTASRDPEPVLYVAPQQHGGAAQRLAPSVPRE